MGERGQSEEETLRVLQEAESGDTVVETYRKHEISQPTFCLWKEKCAGPGLNELRRLPGTSGHSRTSCKYLESTAPILYMRDISKHRLL